MPSARPVLLDARDDAVGFRAPVGAAGEGLRALLTEQPFVGEVGDPALALRRALRRPRRQPDLAHGFRYLTDLFAAASAVLDDALEEVGALFFPIDAGKRFRQRRQHGVLDTIGARSGVGLDHHRLHAFYHDAAAHLDR